MQATAPLPLTEADEQLRAIVRGDDEAQRAMCDPRYNVNAALFFIFNFCRTTDEERGGSVCALPHPDARPFALDFVRALDAPRLEPHNLHDEKCRRLLHTWLACCYNLWAIMWVPGYSSLLISRSEEHVDSNARSESTFSMFGRMRFTYEHLPPHVARPVFWTYKQASCSDTGGSIIGRAPSRDAGRGGGFTRAFVDECAYVEWMDSIHVALDPACKDGKVYMSTVNGPNNTFARIKRERTDGWRFFEADWWSDPLKARDLRPTRTDAERERYGSYVNPWFIKSTRSLRDDEIAREYLRNYSASTRGLVYKEFSVHRHVPDSPLVLDPSKPIVIGADYGATGFGAGVFGQPVGEWSLNVVADFEQENVGGAKALAQYLAELLYRELGFDGDLSDVLVVGGPDTNVSQSGSGQTVAGYFRKVGFTRIRESRIHGPGSVDRGITVVCTSLREDRIVVSPRCAYLVERFGQYVWPVDRMTGQTRGTAPVHNDASHIMDAFRYLVTDVFPNEMMAGVPKARPFEREIPERDRVRDIPGPREGVLPVMTFPARF